MTETFLGYRVLDQQVVNRWYDRVLYRIERNRGGPQAVVFTEKAAYFWRWLVPGTSVHWSGRVPLNVRESPVWMSPVTARKHFRNFVWLRGLR